MVSEPGLYTLILTSRKPEAKHFKRWLTHEVLPEIRRTGTYSVRGNRVAREMKRLKADEQTAKIRCDQFALNKLINRGLADDGACPNDFKEAHNALYRGEFGTDAAGLREKLGLRYWETPLDFMGSLPALINAHAKVLGFESIKSMGPNLPMEAKLKILENTARDLAAADMQRLGPTCHFGVKPSERGPIIDVVRSELAAEGQ